MVEDDAVWHGKEVEASEVAFLDTLQLAGTQKIADFY